MKNSQKKWTVYVIHHSHTDIGYTDRQEKITQYHADYIRQVMDILDAARNGGRTE